MVSPCACSWPECGLYQQIIASKTPTEHCWNGARVRLTFPTMLSGELSAAKAAMKKAAEKYFPLSEKHKSSLDGAKNLVVARHHFPLALLHWKNVRGVKPFATLLSPSDVDEILDFDSPRRRLKEYTNSLRYLCRDQLRDGDDGNLYVQSAMEDKKTVVTFVGCLLSGRFERSQTRGVSTPSGTISESNAAAVVTDDRLNGPGGSTGQIERMHTTCPAIISHNSVFSSPLVMKLEKLFPSCPLTPSRPQHAPDVPGSDASQGLSWNRPGISDLPKPIALFASPVSGGEAIVPKSMPPQMASLLPSMECVAPKLPAVVSKQEARRELCDEFQRIAATSDNAISDFVASPGVTDLAQLLAVFHGEYHEHFQLGRGAWFFSCSKVADMKVGNMSDCEFYSVRPVQWLYRGAILCRACARSRIQKKNNEGRVKNRKRKSDRFQPDETLSTPERKKQNQKRQKVIKNLKSRVQRLIKKLDEHEDSFVVSHDDSVRDVLLKAVAYVTKNKGICHKQVLEEFLSMEIDGDTSGASNGLTKTEISRREACVAHIVEQVTNLSKQLCGKESQCRFSSHVVNTALCLFLRSKAGYEEIRKSGLLCLPSSRHLRSVQGAMKGREGGDPILYSTLQDELPELLRHCPSGTGVMGHLLVDEIKLKNGIAYNCHSEEITGLVFSDLDLKRTYADILTANPDVEAKDATQEAFESKNVTVYANQWRFRSVTNVVHNGDFYFNCGSLSGNELLRQFNQVLATYEFLGVQILGLVCDSGGGNASFLRMLRKQAKVQGPWPSEDCISFNNPVDPKRKVNLWPCSTHGLKALRNNVLRSQQGKTRCFVRDNAGFGWLQMIECWERDEQRRNGPEKLGRSDLVYHAVHLDSFTMMNARFAKQAFSERTIGEMMAHVAAELSVDIDFRQKSTFPSQWHFFSHVLSLLKSSCAEQDGASEQVWSTVRIIEYQVAVFGIFIERFLNKRWKLHEGNIPEEKATCKEILRYFTEWRDERPYLELQRNVESKDSGKYYIADQTYENLLLCVAGFFGYAEAVTKVYSGKTNAAGKRFYVPALHSNQSSLENLFSQMRSLSKDRTEDYAGGIVQMNMLTTLKHLKSGNQMYPKEDIGEEHGLSGCTFETMAKSMKLRESKLSQQIQNWEQDEGSVSDDVQSVPCRILGEDFKHKDSAFGMVFYPRLKTVILGDDEMTFQGFLLQNHRFYGFCMLSQHDTLNKHNKWFTTLLDPKRKEATNRLCQQITGMVFHILEDTYTANKTLGDRSGKRAILRNTKSFEQGVTEFLQEDKMQTHDLDREFFDGVEHDPALYAILFDILKESFFRSWLPSIFRKMKAAQAAHNTITNKDGMVQQETTTEIGANRNVNRCVGWAILKVLRKYRKKEESQCPIVSILEDMTVQELDILGDEQYVRLYYPLDDMLRNRGYLTLVSPAYVKAFSALLAYVMENLKLETLQEHNASKTAKMSVIAKMVIDGKIDIVNEIVDTSQQRIRTEEVTRSERTTLVREIIERLFNMRIGSLVTDFRSSYLMRKNDSSLRTELKVKSNPAE